MGAEALSTFISWAIAIIFFGLQTYFFLNNRRKLTVVKNFFLKQKDYSVTGEGEDSQLDTSIASEGTTLRKLIDELNEYTRKNHGTTDFSIIQNKTERKIEMMYENATSKLAFPIYIGLMGTFLGVFCGLSFFSYGLADSVDGITDDAIGNLIKGVLVSMSTSFIGLLLSTWSNHYSSEVRRVVDEDKNIFFEFIQNQLMPTLGVSMVAALNKLHQTINMFEPSFNRVIDRFQTTFDTCTQRFGDAFARNVEVVSEAVSVMGQNMDKINENVDLQAQLLKTLRSRGVVESLDAFVRAAQNFELVTNALNRFETTRNAIANVTQELINTQRRYNESLELPLSVANKLNQILARVTDFEKSINALGRSIDKTDMWGNTEIEALKDAITAIKKKQKIAVEAMQLSDNHLENIYKMQGEAIKNLGKKYEEALTGFAERYESMLDNLAKELQDRRKEIVSALEEKFSLEQIEQEFSQLSRLKKIEELLGSINVNSSREDVDKTLTETRREVEAIKKSLNELLQEARKKSSDDKDKQSGGFLGGIFGRKNYG